MIQRLYQHIKGSSIKGWMIIVGALGISALPCPECGTPLIFHVWPIAGLVLLARALKKRYQGQDLLLSDMGQHHLNVSTSSPKEVSFEIIEQEVKDGTQ